MPANTHLYRQQSSADNLKKGTWSIWLKRSLLSSNQYIIGNYNNSTNYGFIRFDSTDQLRVNSTISGSTNFEVITNRKFRDTSAWYHIVVRIDTANATSGDRIRVYLNGEEETFSSSTIGNNANHGLFLNSSSTGHRIASQDSVTNQRHDGLMAHIHYSDGYSYAPTEFGSTDTTTGQWKINTSPSITYGSEGYFMFKDNASINDQSGNSNNFTAGGGGAPTPTEDCPSNVFATLNPLVRSSASKTYAHGNNSITASDSGNWCSTQSTLGASAGKYYCEIKINAVGSFHAIGVGYQPNITNTTSTQLIGELTGSAGWRNNGVLVHGGSNINTYTTGDILMIAMDLDNQKLYFGKNGTWENSGDPTSGATGTGSLKDLTANEYYHFVICPRGGSTYCNFGNSYFGTTAISSEGTNASGIGKFEYDVPTGYTALSTKGLNE